MQIQYRITPLGHNKAQFKPKIDQKMQKFSELAKQFFAAKTNH